MPDLALPGRVRPGVGAGAPMLAQIVFELPPEPDSAVAASGPPVSDPAFEPGAVPGTGATAGSAAGSAADAAGGGFSAAAQAALEALAHCAGFRAGRLARALDAPRTWLLTTEWDGPGPWRRALSAFDVRCTLTPLLVHAVDVPGSFEVLAAVDAATPAASISPRLASAPASTAATSSSSVRAPSVDAPSAPPASARRPDRRVDPDADAGAGGTTTHTYRSDRAVDADTAAPGLGRSQ
ncbi:putative peptidoglycan bound protein [Frankia sp. AiPs1]|uniref:peptidoglycan-binding protein n=1 Tax=Frankia sp. AiPa1 TaxID=573492 RepID=UPI00202B42FA|nr:peptidoglycan-binding protein [Frankia sp. AiPa1]MCL9761732.1 peptidoglycan-binding protein [Frankia sp. AiPa1]